LKALVSGAEGSIGSAVAARLTRDGWEIVSVESSHRQSSRSQLVVDFGNDVELGAAIEAVAQDLNAIAICHGYNERGPYDRVSPAQWRKLLDANLTSVYVILYHALPKMPAGSSVGIVSSTAGLDRTPVGGPHYTVSKWGLHGLVRHLAADVGPRNIRINAIVPGFVDNEAGRSFLDGEARDRFLQTIPLRRAATPEEIAAVMAFVLSPDAAYVTGALIPITGGYR
jgi:NAD(P)-dependent dehydrogenase (short-subunit alcohol dehydrogenase family)